MRKDITKEQLAELIGLAELMEEKLKDLDIEYLAEEANLIAYALKIRFDRLCGDEELARMRGDK